MTTGTTGPSGQDDEPEGHGRAAASGRAAAVRPVGRGRAGGDGRLRAGGRPAAVRRGHGRGLRTRRRSATPSATPSASPTASPSATAPTPSAAAPATPAPARPAPSPAASPTGAAGAVDRSTAVWPVEGSDVSYPDPVAAATGFATDFVGFQAPVVGAFQQGDARSGEVEVRPRADGPVTTVLVRQLSGEDTWSVLGAVTAGIELTEPAASAVISSPVTVRGSALAFEGTVLVEVREDGRREPLGEGFVTAGGDVMRPFEGTIDFAPPSQEHGALVLFTESAEDGQVWEASVLRVGLEPAAGA